MSKLRIRNGPYSGREKTLTQAAVSIGRDAEAGVQILDRSASRFHAEVFPVGGMWFVRDLESKNGTFVNDEKLADEELLREGDVIKIGTTELIYESGMALAEGDSSDRISYHDDAAMLSNTLEFRLDELADIADEADDGVAESRSLQLLYQFGRIISRADDAGMAAAGLDYLLKAMPAESAIIFLRQGDAGKLVPLTVRTIQQAVNPVICRTIIRRTVTENRAFFTADAQVDERLNRKDSVIAKGIRSVVCVPLAVSGQTRGVLYASRGPGDDPFDKGHMELLSACALQLSLAFENQERLAARLLDLERMLLALARTIEGQGSRVGSAERIRNAAAALGAALQLSEASVRNLRLAAVLDRCGQGLGGADGLERLLGHLEGTATLEDALPLARTAHERLDGSGPFGIPEEQQGIETRILAVCTAFAAALLADPDAEVVQVIDRLAGDTGLDTDVCGKLKACHLDGSLYQAPVQFRSAAPATP